MAKLQTELNPDILEIKQNVWLGLSLRQLVSAGIGIALAGLAYMKLDGQIGTQAASWVAVAIAAVFMFFGFFTFNGMPAEKLLLAFYRDLNNPLEVGAQLNNLYYNNVQKTVEKEAHARATAKNSKTDREESSGSETAVAEDTGLDPG